MTFLPGLGATRGGRHHAAMTLQWRITQVRNRRILLSGGAGVAQRFAQLIAALVTLPLTLHALGEAGFGVWGAATSLAWAGGVLDLGLGAALVTLVPQALARGEDAGGDVAASLFGGAALGSALLLVGGIFALAAPHELPGPPFLIACLGMALNIPLGIAGNIWFGLQRGHIAAMWDMAMTCMMLAFIILAVALGGGVVVMVACVYGAMVLASGGSLAHVLIRHPDLRPRFAALSRHGIRRVLRTGLLLSAISMIASCSYVFDNVITLHWLGADAAARMTIAMRLCITAIGMLGVATHALWPAFVEATAARDHGWVLRALAGGTLGVLALALVGSALIVLYGDIAVQWWLRENLHLPPLLLWAVAAWIVVLSLPRVAGLLLNAVSIFRGQILVQCVATTAALVAKVFLGERLGAAGILLATPLAWLFIVCPAYAWMAAAWTGAPQPLLKAET